MLQRQTGHKIQIENLGSQAQEKKNIPCWAWGSIGKG
jgi:hypothetical protein